MTTTVSDVEDVVLDAEPEAPAANEVVSGAAGDIGAIDPRRVRLFRGPHGVLRCTIEGDRTVLQTKVVHAFPLSDRSRWISVLDGKNKEVCLIEDPAALDDRSCRLVDEALAVHYRIAVIERIHAIRTEYRTMFWDVETDRGRRDFVVKTGADTVLWYEPHELVLVDIDTNRFVIPDVTRLDFHSRKQLAVVL